MCYLIWWFWCIHFFLSHKLSNFSFMLLVSPNFKSLTSSFYPLQGSCILNFRCTIDSIRRSIFSVLIQNRFLKQILVLKILIFLLNFLKSTHKCLVFTCIFIILTIRVFKKQLFISLHLKILFLISWLKRFRVF